MKLGAAPGSVAVRLLREMEEDPRDWPPADVKKLLRAWGISEHVADLSDSGRSDTFVHPEAPNYYFVVPSKDPVWRQRVEGICRMIRQIHAL